MKRLPQAATTARHARAAVLPTPVVLGDWRLVRPLAQSQRGMVYEARPAASGCDDVCEYLVKILPEQIAADPHARSMFRREVCVGGKVSHIHLVPVVDANLDGLMAENRAAGPCFLVMPRVVGQTLEQTLASSASLAWEQACWFARQTAEALRCLHVEGWLHADIKPSNILIAPDGHVTLLDLGFVQPLNTLRNYDSVIASRRQAVTSRRQADSSEGESGCLVGTLKYIAPEMLQRTGRLLPASDVYSLGLVLYEMLAGQHPFAQATEMELVRLHMQAVPIDIRALAPTVPESLAVLLQSMLAKEPLRRPASVEVIVRELVRLEIAALSQMRATA